MSVPQAGNPRPAGGTRNRKVKEMPIVVFFGAVLFASVIGSALSFLSNTLKAQRERREAAREERILNNRYFLINAELNGEALFA